MCCREECLIGIHILEVSVQSLCHNFVFALSWLSFFWTSPVTCCRDILCVVWMSFKCDYCHLFDAMSSLQDILLLERTHSMNSEIVSCCMNSESVVQRHAPSMWAGFSAVQQNSVSDKLCYYWNPSNFSNGNLLKRAYKCMHLNSPVTYFLLLSSQIPSVIFISSSVCHCCWQFYNSWHS